MESVLLSSEDDSAAFLQIATAGAGKLYTDLCNCEDPRRQSP